MFHSTLFPGRRNINLTLCLMCLKFVLFTAKARGALEKGHFCLCVLNNVLKVNNGMLAQWLLVVIMYTQLPVY